MKKNDLKTMKGKEAADLEKEVSALRTRLTDLKFDLAAGKVKNIREIRATRKGVAQLLTLIKEKSAK